MSADLAVARTPTRIRPPPARRSAIRRWTVPITRPLLPEDLERARAIVRYRWGSSADVNSYDSGLLTFLAPEAAWVGDELRQAVERCDSVQGAPGRRSTRGKRTRRR